MVKEFPDLGRSDSFASHNFAQAFAMVGNDPRKALLVARTVQEN